VGRRSFVNPQIKICFAANSAGLRLAIKMPSERNYNFSGHRNQLSQLSVVQLDLKLDLKLDLA
jgi:hypothetical protein